MEIRKIICFIPGIFSTSEYDHRFYSFSYFNCYYLVKIFLFILQYSGYIRIYVDSKVCKMQGKLHSEK